MIDPTVTHIIAKPVATSIAAYAGHQFLYGGALGPNTAMTFGAAVGAGVLAADLITKYAGHGNNVEKSIEQRVLEVGIGSGLGIAVDNYMNGARYDTMMRGGLAVAAEVVGEYTANTFLGFR